MKYIGAIWYLIIAFILIFFVVNGVDKIKEDKQKIKITVNKYNDPIFTWNEEERYLVITSHMRRDALICMRDQCKMVEEWIGK